MSTITPMHEHNHYGLQGMCGNATYQYVLITLTCNTSLVILCGKIGYHMNHLLPIMTNMTKVDVLCCDIRPSITHCIRLTIIDMERLSSSSKKNAYTFPRLTPHYFEHLVLIPYTMAYSLDLSDKLMS